MRLLFTIFILAVSHLTFAQKSETQVHRYTSIEAWNTNAFWIETENGIVIIDGLMLKNDAMKMSSMIKLSKKPVIGLFVTHPHVDHFAGIAAIQDELGKFPIFALEQTAKFMEVEFKRFISGAFSKPFGDKVETRLVSATNILKHGDIVNLDGWHFEISDLDAGESVNNLVVSIADKKWLFTGDVTMHHAHYYLAESRSKRSIAQLELLKGKFSDYQFFAGHGEPSSSAIVDENITYIKTIQNLVLAAAKDKSNIDQNTQLLKAAVRARLIDKILSQYSHYLDFGFNPKEFISYNLWGVENEMLVKK